MRMLGCSDAMLPDEDTAFGERVDRFARAQMA